MKRMNRWLAIALLAPLLIPPSHLLAGISVRGTVLLPQDSFQDFARKGLGVEIGADLRPLPTKFLSAIVLIDYSGFGEKSSSYESTEGSINQKSKINLTGGGIGVRIQPPLLMIRPFAEIVAKVASVEQDYKSGDSHSETMVRGKTIFGYQLNGGLRYSLVPTLSLEVGGSYLKLPKVPLMLDGSERKIDVRAIGVFAGLSFALGW